MLNPSTIRIKAVAAGCRTQMSIQSGHSWGPGPGGWRRASPASRNTASGQPIQDARAFPGGIVLTSQIAAPPVN